MGFIGSLLGTSSNFNANGGATVGQAGTAYDQTQQGIQQQQGLNAQLAGQNGVGNQSQVYNQLQNVANGTGPNPAQAMLNQSTGQNNAAQAALMAGQRGAGANTGLIARQAAQLGAANQQNAIGQAATLQANQSLNALGQAVNLATSQVNQQQTGISGLNQEAQGQQSNLLNSLGQQNQTNAGVQIQNSKNNMGLVGGIANGIGSATNLFAGGGIVGPQSKVGRHLCSGGMMKSGGKVPGKAQVPGNSFKNDTVSAKLSPGEIVVPRSAASDPEKAAAFARAVAMRNKGKK